MPLTSFSQRVSESRSLLDDLRERVATNRFALQELVQRVMAHPCVAFQLPNSSLENVLFDVFACNYTSHPAGDRTLRYIEAGA